MRNAAQNLQWIFKTLIALLQKCFKHEDFIFFNDSFKAINNLTFDVLSIKGESNYRIFY